MGIAIRVDGAEGLGAGRRASPEELAALDELGFVVVPSLLPEGEVALLSAEFELLVAADPEAKRHELGTRRTKASNSNPLFVVCWRHPVVLDAASHILGPTFDVGHVDLRDPSPGHGEQRLHPDHGATPVPGITATWYLDAFTAENGATRVLPGSHRSPPPSSEVPIPGTEVPVAGEAVAIGSSGSLLLRDARLFHAGGRNATRYPCRSAVIFYQHRIPEPD